MKGWHLCFFLNLKKDTGVYASACGRRESFSVREHIFRIEPERQHCGNRLELQEAERSTAWSAPSPASPGQKPPGESRLPRLDFKHKQKDYDIGSAQSTDKPLSLPRNWVREGWGERGKKK